MPTLIGEVAALYRYPVKSMAGQSLRTADLGWHGFTGDRRLALRRVDDRGGFPWLTASKLPELILYVPGSQEPAADADLPPHVLTPEAQKLPVFSPELAAEIGRRHGSPVEMMHLSRGIFDEASVSLISTATVNAVAALSAQLPDVRRFRPNILIANRREVPFEEDEWVGGVLTFGASSVAPEIALTNWDERCSMVNFDPETAKPTPEVLRAIAQARNNKAGVYGAVLGRGRIEVGQPVYFERVSGSRTRA